MDPRVRFSLKENRMKCHGSLGLYRKLRAARHILNVYGPTKPVPFVERVFPQPVKSWPDTKHEFSASCLVASQGLHGIDPGGSLGRQPRGE